jgi:phosphatidylethanolamine/phosphatidyl-N-methylethanolamine N-methyltransferase
MSAALFFKRFLQRPMQVASIVPSSKVLIDRVSSKFDFSQPRVIAEFGPGEGCHTREYVKRMHPESRLLLFELDPELANHLRHYFRDDARVSVLNTDAANLPEELAKIGVTHCDYVVSGIPFSTMEITKKRKLLQCIFDSLKLNATSAFIIYQVTNELVGHCKVFPRKTSEYCLQNIPPMFVTVYFKQALNGHSHNGNGNGSGKNGNGKHL